MDKLPKKILDVFDSDVAYVTLMNNKELIHDIMSLVIKEAVEEKNRPPNVCVFGGSFVWGRGMGFSGDTNLSSMVDPYTVDIISNLFKESKPAPDHKTQGIYRNFSDWIRRNNPKPKKITIYFAGEAHADEGLHPGKQKHLDIHWNCFIVDLIQKKIFWYDPSESINDVSSGYNFNNSTKEYICTYLNLAGGIESEAYDLLTFSRAQQTCNPAYPDADIFCQTWVIFFASAWVNNCFPAIVVFPFEKISNFPLKLWMKCVISRLEDWHETFKRKEFKLFQSFYREKLTDYEVRLVALPEPVKQKCHKKPCIYSVITLIMDLNDCYNPKEENEYTKAVMDIRDKWMVEYTGSPRTQENPERPMSPEIVRSRSPERPMSPEIVRSRSPERPMSPEIVRQNRLVPPEIAEPRRRRADIIPIDTRRRSNRRRVD